MNVLMLYPKFPEEMIYNSRPSLERFTPYRGILPPLGLLTIASYLPEDFHVRLVDRNVCAESEADWNWADVVFLSVMLGQHDDYDLCVARARAHRTPVAVGGPLTHAMPDVVTRDADWVCFAEAESIIDELVADIRADRRGRRYDGGSKTDLSRVRVPRFEIIPDIGAYGIVALQFSRGCPFKCEFCDIIEIYGRVPRTKTPAQMLTELSSLKDRGFRGVVFLVDDNFIGNKKQAKVLLGELAVWNRDNDYPFRFMTEASLNVADDAELLRGLALANFATLFIGIETPQADLLRTTLKTQNIHGDLLDKLHRIRQHGLHITAGIVVGFDGERRNVFDVQRDFIEASGIGSAMAVLLHAIPHTQLHRRLEREGRFLRDLTSSGAGAVDPLPFVPTGINFIPRGELTKREYLLGYAALVRALYRPEAHFRRIAAALLAMRYIGPRRGYFTTWRRTYPLFLRQLVHFGVRARGSRRAFWSTLLRVLVRNPMALEAFAWECFYCYHLNEYAEFAARAYVRYVAAPAANDVLDEVLGPGIVAAPAR